MAIGRFLFITIDAQDAERVADFWAVVLGTERDEVMDEGRFILLKGRDDLPVICIQRVPEPKTGKVRIHLDLAVPDLDSATDRIRDLGGDWDGTEQMLEGYVWRTVRDPEGHEFDITQAGTPQV